MSIENFANIKPVQEYVAYIRTRMLSTNKNWSEIAIAMSEALEMYGSDSSSYRLLLKESKFTKGTASKLVTIATSKRLRKYAVQLSLVHSWGTLYAVASLNEEKFGEFKKVYRFDDPNSVPKFITQEDVNRIKRGTSQASPFRNFAIIQLDEEALKGGLFSGDDCKNLNDLISKIESLSDYLCVKRTEMDDKEDAKYMNRLEDKKKQITRKHFLEGIAGILSKSTKEPNETFKEHYIRCFGNNRDELLADYQDDPKKMFARIGITYDEAEFYNEAQKELSSAADKFAQKVLKRLPKLGGMTNEASALKKAA